MNDVSQVVYGHALPSLLQGEVESPQTEGSREAGQELGRRGADFAGVLRAASWSQALINIDKVTSRKLTLLNSNLIITFHVAIKTSQMAAAMCAGGKIGGLQALEKFF